MEGTGQANSRVTFNGTITGADGGVFVASDADRTVDGTGTILFTMVAATTAGADNFGGTAWDVRATIDISGMTADFSESEALTEEAYILIDYSAGNGNLVGTFAGELALPTGYFIDYNYLGASQIALIPEPGIFPLVALSGLAFFLRRRRS